MVRTQIYLTERQRDDLTAMAKTMGKKQGELIRKDIDRLIESFLKKTNCYVCPPSFLFATRKPEIGYRLTPRHQIVRFGLTLNFKW